MPLTGTTWGINRKGYWPLEGLTVNKWYRALRQETVVESGVYSCNKCWTMVTISCWTWKEMEARLFSAKVCLLMARGKWIPGWSSNHVNTGVSKHRIACCFSGASGSITRRLNGPKTIWGTAGWLKSLGFSFTWKKQQMLFFVGTFILIVIGIFCWLKIKRFYEKGIGLPTYVSVSIWILDAVHGLIVILASLTSVWRLPFNRMVSLILGFIMLGCGLILMLKGMMEFRSLSQISGSDQSHLVKTGVYRWSRNPQYVGWFIWLLGVSLMGRSGLAFLFTIVFIAGIHLYNIELEEPYLERIFGEEYRLYKSSTPRYLGMPK